MICNCNFKWTVFVHSFLKHFLGAYGQLGHGIKNNEVLPRKVVEIMGTTCTQISTGSRHTLTYVPSRGRIYAFGLGNWHTQQF